MSTITNTREAYKALCSGEFFQVGEKIINPDDIVRFTREEEPVFYLEDGSKAQHDKYAEGSAGDLLADALRVARRGQGQAQIAYTSDEAPTWQSETNYVTEITASSFVLSAEPTWTGSTNYTTTI